MPSEDASLLAGIDIVAILGMARRHWRLVAKWVVGLLAAAIAFGLVSDVKYTAQVSILVGVRDLRASQEISAPTDPQQAVTLVDNQIEFVKSDSVMLAAAEALKLKNDPEFNGDQADIITVVTRLAQKLNPIRYLQQTSGGPGLDPDYVKSRIVLSKLTAATKVARSGKANVIQIAVTAAGAQKAARIANGIAKAYDEKQLGARFEKATEAGRWIDARILEAQESIAVASRELEDFRQKNNLTLVNGMLVIDKNLGDVNDQINLAKKDVVERQSKVSTLRAALESGRADATTQELLADSVVSQFRREVGELTKRYNELVARLGEKHEQSVALSRRIDETNRAMRSELARQMVSFESDLNRAIERRDSLENEYRRLRQQSDAAKELQFQLSQLEQSVENKKRIQQLLQQRREQTAQQATYPIDDTLTISYAAPPLLPSEPRWVLLVALAILGGIAVGGGVAAYRELIDRGFRTTEHIEKELGIESFGIVPLVESGPKGAQANSTLDRIDAGNAAVNVARFAARFPFSRFSETLRAAKIALDTRVPVGRGKVLGIASTLPNEGKSTISSNLASLLALQKFRVVVIDADMRGAGLTRQFQIQPVHGLDDVLAGRAPLSAAMVTDPESGIDVIPALAKSDNFVSSDLLGSEAMSALVKGLVAHYDYVVIDLPPIGPVVDARTAARILDAVLLVVEWGNVPRRVVHAALGSSPEVAEKIIGAVLNKVELAKMHTYEPNGLDRRQLAVFDRYYR